MLVSPFFLLITPSWSTPVVPVKDLVRLQSSGQSGNGTQSLSKAEIRLSPTQHVQQLLPKVAETRSREVRKRPHHLIMSRNDSSNANITVSKDNNSFNFINSFQNVPNTSCTQSVGSHKLPKSHNSSRTFHPSHTSHSLRAGAPVKDVSSSLSSQAYHEFGDGYHHIRENLEKTSFSNSIGDVGRSPVKTNSTLQEVRYPSLKFVSGTSKSNTEKNQQRHWRNSSLR